MKMKVWKIKFATLWDWHQGVYDHHEDALDERIVVAPDYDTALSLATADVMSSTLHDEDIDNTDKIYKILGVKLMRVEIIMSVDIVAGG